jgi:thioredoxin-like negative regulator of GroEL
VGAADLLARLGRVADAEKILAEVDTLYPGWARIPVVRAQIAFVRLGAMAMIDQARRRSDLPPDEQARMLEGQMRALGITENDRVEDQLAAVRRHLDEADGRGGGRSADRVREMYLLAQADLRMSGGDFGGAQQLLEDALKERPRLRGVAVTLAAILLARGEDARARAALEPVASAGAPVEKLAELAGEMAERIRPRLEATQGPNPFDLSAPPGTVPSTEPALTMPGLGGRRPGGLGEGLQLRF